MAIRIIHTLSMAISEDIAEPQKQLLFQRDADLQKQTIDTYLKEVSGNFIVIGGNQENLSLGDIALPAKGLYLEANAECSIRLNGSADPVILRLPSSPQTGAKVKYFVEGDITAVEVDASENADVSGAYAMWGGGTT